MKDGESKIITKRGLRCLAVVQFYSLLYAPATRAFVKDVPVSRRRGAPLLCGRTSTSLKASLFPRDQGRVGILFSNDPFFPPLSAESSDYFQLAEEHDVQVLSYLPNSGSYLPPQTLEVLNKVTNNYIFENIKGRQRPLSSEDILISIETEYDTRNVPLVLDNRTVVIPENGGKEAIKDFTEILSLSALHGLPKEIAVVLLSEACSDIMEPYINTFAMGGWDSVSFPKGLSVTLKKEFRKKDDRTRIERMWNRRNRTKRRASEAHKAVMAARQAIAPDKVPLQSREELFAQIEELSDSESSKRNTKDELLFFPNSVPLKNLSFKEIRRVAKRQYTKLKRKGRAGILSYLIFNFLFYTIGVLWQWPRIAIPDPLTSTTTSAVMLVTKKCGRVFGSLYVAAQILKLPKVLMAIGITPLSQRILNFVRRKLRVSETVALVSVGAVMFATWVVLCGVPIVSDFAKLRNLVFMDEKMVQVYGLQPV